MKVKKKPMPLFQKIFYVASFVFLIVAFIYLGTKNYQVNNKITDAESFTKEYGITKDNVYKYKTAKEILELLNSGTGIVFFGYPDSTWSPIYADILNDTAKKYRVSEIYYYNILSDRKANNFYYEHIVDLLSSYLPVLDNGDVDIYVPSVVFVKNGTILFYDDETSITKGSDTLSNYWSTSRRNQKSISLGTMFQEYLKGSI